MIAFATLLKLMVDDCFTPISSYRFYPKFCVNHKRALSESCKLCDACGLRSHSCLHIFSLEQIETDLKSAYIVRSYYAHGESRNHKKATYELSERVSEYARIILLTFLFISPIVKTNRGKTEEKKYINE